MALPPQKIYGDYKRILPIATSVGQQKATVYGGSPYEGQATYSATSTYTIGDDPYSALFTITESRSHLYVLSVDEDAKYETNRESFARRGVGDLVNDWPEGRFNRMRLMHKAWGCTQPQKGPNVTNSGETHHYSTHMFPPDTPRTTSKQESPPDYAISVNNGKSYAYLVLPDEFNSDDCGWLQIVIDPKMTHMRSGGKPPYSHRPYALNTWATWGPPNNPEPQQWPDHGFFDCTTSWYLEPRYEASIDYENGHERGFQVFSTPLMYEEETNANGIQNEINLVTHISNLCATYMANTNKVWWACNAAGSQSMLGSTYVIECRYSFSTTYVLNGFDDAEPMPTPTNAERTVTDSVYNPCTFEEVDIVWPEGETVMYIALRVQGQESWGHREIAVMKDNNQIPPLPGESL